MAQGNPPQVREGKLQVPAGAGLGLDFNWDYIRKNLADGEPWWG
jgi:L-alanine-DL-glutamate epimerase-like enolase superfamily enzyme